MRRNVGRYQSVLLARRKRLMMRTSRESRLQDEEPAYLYHSSFRTATAKVKSAQVPCRPAFEAQREA
jgi:hypothetical protein